MLFTQRSIENFPVSAEHRWLGYDDRELWPVVTTKGESELVSRIVSVS